MLNRESLQPLVKRSLALKHKLKVFESLQHPATHEELAQQEIVKWELEDELQAILETIEVLRRRNVDHYKVRLTESGPVKASSVRTG